MFEISLILALAAVACSDHLYFSTSIALVSAVDNDIPSCIKKETGKTVRK